MTKTKAEIGTLSHGTMRPEDLIPCFTDELHRLGDKAATKYQRLANLGRVTDAYWESEAADWDLETLFDALEALAPEGCRFGAHEGDGSDYGFWPCGDTDEDTDAESEVPAE